VQIEVYSGAGPLLVPLFEGHASSVPEVCLAAEMIPGICTEELALDSMIIEPPANGATET
jgi:hypothetical protein